MTMESKVKYGAGGRIRKETAMRRCCQGRRLKEGPRYSKVVEREFMDSGLQLVVDEHRWMNVDA